MTIGQRIKAARKNAGMKRSTLAEKLNVSVVTIGQYERNQRQPRYEQLQRIADTLGVECGYFLSENDPDKQTSVSDEAARIMHSLIEESNKINTLVKELSALIGILEYNAQIPTAVQKEGNTCT